MPDYFGSSTMPGFTGILSQFAPLILGVLTVALALGIGIGLIMRFVNSSGGKF